MSIIPVWFMIISPMVWLFLLPAVALLVFVVLFFLSRIFKLDDPTTFIKKAFLKVALVTFVSYFASTVMLFLSQGAANDWWYEYLTSPVAFNPFDNIFSLIFTLLCLAVGGVAAYFMDTKFALNSLIKDDKLRRMFAISLAILTVPLIYLTPSRLLFDEPGARLYTFTNHIVWTVNDTVTITDAAGVETTIESTYETPDGEGTLSQPDYWALADAINHASPAKDTPTGDPMHTLHFYGTQQQGRPVKVGVLEAGDDLVFLCDAGVFIANPDEADAVREVLAK